MGWLGRVRVEAASKWRPTRIAGGMVVPSRATWQVVGDGDAPDAVAHFEVRDGMPELREVRLVAKPDGRALRTSDFDAFRSENLTRNVFEMLVMSVDAFDEQTGEMALEPATPEEARRAIGNTPIRRPGRPSGVTRQELERVAEIYREDTSGSPVKAVRTVLGYTSERTAARRVKQAEEAGLLPATTRGRRRTAPKEG